MSMRRSAYCLPSVSVLFSGSTRAVSSKVRRRGAGNDQSAPKSASRKLAIHEAAIVITSRLRIFATFKRKGRASSARPADRLAPVVGIGQFHGRLNGEKPTEPRSRSYRGVKSSLKKLIVLGESSTTDGYRHTRTNIFEGNRPSSKARDDLVVGNSFFSFFFFEILSPYQRSILSGSTRVSMQLQYH